MVTGQGSPMDDVLRYAESVADAVAFDLSQHDINTVSNGLGAVLDPLTEKLVRGCNLSPTDAGNVAAIIVDRVLARVEEYQRMPQGHA